MTYQLAAWHVHHVKRFGRVEAKTGIEPFGRLVEQVIGAEPYASPRRVFWIVDNGSSHAGRASIERLAGALREPAPDPPADPRLLAQPDRTLLLDRPAQALPPTTSRTSTLTARPLAFEDHYRQIAQPCDWTFTRADLDRALERTADRQPELRLAA